MKNLITRGFNALGDWLGPKDEAPGIDEIIAGLPAIIARLPPKHVHLFTSDQGMIIYHDAKTYAVYCECGEFRLYEFPESWGEDC